MMAHVAMILQVQVMSYDQEIQHQIQKYDREIHHDREIPHQIQSMDVQTRQQTIMMLQQHKMMLPVHIQRYCDVQTRQQTTIMHQQHKMMVPVLILKLVQQQNDVEMMKHLTMILMH